jgi:hypothetical protein
MHMFQESVCILRAHAHSYKCMHVPSISIFWGVGMTTLVYMFAKLVSLVLGS